LDKCLHSLQEIRRVKWFNYRLRPIANAMLIVRLLRDLANRSAAWSCLSDWLIEILVDKCFIRNKYEDIALKFRNVFEFMASGVLLLTNLNVSKQLVNLSDEHNVLIICDPCEDNRQATTTTTTTTTAPTTANTSQDGQQPEQMEESSSGAVAAEEASAGGEQATSSQTATAAPVSRVSVVDTLLTEQQKEDLTASAQSALRMIAFNKIHQLLGMELVAKKIYETGKNVASGAANGCAATSSQGGEPSGTSQENNNEGGEQNEDGHDDGAENDEGPDGEFGSEEIGEAGGEETGADENPDAAAI
jgi:hypothetical protein